MTSQQIVLRVNELMKEGFEIPPEKLIPTATVFEDLGLDSLDAVDMLVNLEDKLQIKVDVERLKQVKTLQDIYDLVRDLTTLESQIKIDQ